MIMLSNSERITLLGDWYIEYASKDRSHISAVFYHEDIKDKELSLVVDLDTNMVLDFSIRCMRIFEPAHDKSYVITSEDLKSVKLAGNNFILNCDVAKLCNTFFKSSLVIRQMPNYRKLDIIKSFIDDSELSYAEGLDCISYITNKLV